MEATEQKGMLQRKSFMFPMTLDISKAVLLEGKKGNYEIISFCLKYFTQREKKTKDCGKMENISSVLTLP